jgi:hypothetical protein
MSCEVVKADNGSRTRDLRLGKATLTNFAGAGVDITGVRADLVAREDFEGQFAAAKRQVTKLPVQFVTEDRADLRSVFEVYATYVSGTEAYTIFATD